jgi:hypothetical protein
MRLHTLLLLILLNGFANASNIGKGLLIINPQARLQINLYSFPTDTNPKQQLIFFDDPSINSINIQNLKEQSTWLKPYAINLDYDIFYLKYTHLKGNWVQVIVNDSTGETLWLMKDKHTKEVTWEDFWASQTYIYRLTSNNPIHVEPKTKSDTISPKRTITTFQVLKVNNNWIFVKEVNVDKEFYGWIADNELIKGWIKWKDDQQLLIAGYLD